VQQVYHDDEENTKGGHETGSS